MTQQQNKQSCAFQWARTKKNGDSPAPGGYGLFTWAGRLRQSTNPRVAATIVVDLARK